MRDHAEVESLLIYSYVIYNYTDVNFFVSRENGIKGTFIEAQNLNTMKQSRETICFFVSLHTEDRKKPMCKLKD